MIFVTVGTHEQPFDRLLKCIDKMVEDGKITEKVIIQKGYTDFEPKNCESYKLIGYDEMQKYINEARIIVTHGGPASFIAPLSIGKIPIVVPRKKEFNEHVNNHQLEFAKEVEKRMKNIIIAENDKQLIDSIINYDQKIETLSQGILSNNREFNQKLEKEIKKYINNRGVDNMSKIGILSMQRIKNYGSFLQAFALKSILEEQGHEVEFVDYHIEKPLIEDETQSNNNIIDKIKKTTAVLKGKEKLLHKIQYIIHKKNFGKKYYPLLNIDEYNYNPKLAVLVIGSDEVFNCIQKNYNVGYSLELFGKDNNAKKVITYAASFGNTTIEKIKKYNKEEEIAELLKKMSAISVRDNNSGKIVKELAGIEPIYNLDPVLAYDYMKKCKQIPNIKTREKYMIVYAYSGRISSEEAKYIRKYAQKKNLKVYSIGGAQECADKFIDCSPFEVLAYFRNAELVITDTFHGSIFSIITKRNFVTLVRRSVGNAYGNEEKITDLLNRLQLEDRIVYDINETEEKIEKIIDYTKTNEIIENERNQTIKYLRKEI